MDRSLTGQIDALRLRIRGFAPEVFDCLRSAGWPGWKPKSIGDVEHYLHRHLDAVMDGATRSEGGGIIAEVESADQFGPVVVLGFRHVIEAHVDPPTGTAYVIPAAA